MFDIKVPNEYSEQEIEKLAESPMLQFVKRLSNVRR